MNEKNIYRDIIVLYCPEKVGSTSIVSSIRISASDKFMVFHTHENKIADLYNGKNNIISIDDIIKNNNIYNIQTNKYRKIYIIDVYRSPIERKISYFFQKLSELHFNNSELNISNYPIEKIFKRFNDIFIHIEEIDYFNTYYKCDKINKFDFKKKYVMKEINNVVFIKLRLEDSKDWGNILSEILETQIYLIHDYNTVNKNIGNLYNKFKELYKLPINYYKLIESDPLIDIYMSSEEKKIYLEKWYKKISLEYPPFTSSEYNIYKKISEENKFYCANLSNKHYGDDGCLCIKCCEQRNLTINNIVNNIPQDIYIRHAYDNLYNNFIYLKLYSQDMNNPEEITINLINL